MIDTGLNSQDSQEAASKLLIELYAQPGVSGVCLQNGRTIIKHDLPFSDERVTSFSNRVDHLIGGYGVVGRNIWQVCAGFENFWLLILCHKELRLSLLLKPNSDTSLISSRAAHLLMQMEATKPAAPAPMPQAAAPTEVSSNGHHPPVGKEDLEKILSGLLSRVTGSAQAGKIIDRELSKFPGVKGFSVAEANEIGQAVIDFVPNRGKRASLLSEFQNAINS